VSLQENLISIINYNLDSEYDVKILDPNFVKLFKLAQLSIDYLLYSEQHFYNCTELEQRQTKKYIKVFTILCFYGTSVCIIKSNCTISYKLHSNHVISGTSSSTIFCLFMSYQCKSFNANVKSLLLVSI